MSKLMKTMRNILFVFIVVTILIHFSPTISKTIAEKVSLTNEELGNLLTSLDIFFSTVIAVYSLVDQKIAERRCIYDFSIEKDNLSLEAYRRFPSETENAYSYEYQRKSNDIEKPYYGMEVILEDKPICSVGIPLCMEVSTGLDGESITFSNLIVYTRKKGEIRKSKKLSQGTVIEKPIQAGNKFLIRIQLLCNHELEKLLLNSCVYLNFILILKDDRGRTYKKYIFLKVQNTMGESRILSISSRNNWITYIEKMLKLQYQLYKKR